MKVFSATGLACIVITDNIGSTLGMIGKPKENPMNVVYSFSFRFERVKHIRIMDFIGKYARLNKNKCGVIHLSKLCLRF